MRRFAIAAALCALCAARSEAAFISYNVHSDSLLQAGLAPLFDPTLGTLTEIRVASTGSGLALYTGVNPQPVTVTYNGTGSLVGINGGFVTDFGSSTRTGLTAVASPFTPLELDLQFTSSADITDAATLASYTGTGLFNLAIAVSFTITDTSPTTTFRPLGGRDSLASADSIVTYVFTPAAVPEPSSLALCGIAGLSGLAYAWRRGRSA